MARVVNTEKLDGFKEDVYVALDPEEWRDVHQIAVQLYGPTTKVNRGGRTVEVPTLASGSGIETTLDWLVEHGFASAKRRPFAPLGKVWKRGPFG